MAVRLADDKKRDWWDEIPGAYARNLARLIVGQTFLLVHDDGSEEERTIIRVAGATLGLDSRGLFCAVNVVDEHGDKWTLYQDGHVADSDDRDVGGHRLRGELERRHPWIAAAVSGAKPFRIVDDYRDYGHYATFDGAKAALADLVEEVAS